MIGRASESSESRRAALGLLRVLGWLLVARATISVVASILSTQLGIEIRASRWVTDIESLRERSQLYARLDEFSAVALQGAVAIVLFLLWRNRHAWQRWQRWQRRGRALIAIAAATLATLTAIGALMMIRDWLGANALNLDLWRYVYVARIVLATLAYLALLGFAVTAINAQRSSEKSAAPANLKPVVFAAVPFLVWPTLFALSQVYGKAISSFESPWLVLFLGEIMWAAGVLWLVYFIRRSAHSMTASGTSTPATGVAGVGALHGDWTRAASGLELYASALAWRVGLTAGGFLLLFMGAIARSPGILKLVGWLLPLASAATVTAMAMGIARFAKQPESSPARWPARVGFAAMFSAMMLEGYGLWLALRVLTADPEDYAAVALLERAQSNSMWALAFGFTALAALMVSFGKIARGLGDTQLFGRVLSVASALVIVSLFAFGLRSGGTGIGLAVLVLAVALLTLAAYIRLVRAVAAELPRHTADAAELPRARVVPENS